MAERLKIQPTGRINRRSLVSELKDTQVLVRENLIVQGQSEGLYVKKHPGSDRFNSTSFTQGQYGATWIDRYYTKQDRRKTFFFANGVLKYIDENGNITDIISTFDLNAFPCSVTMRVSNADIMYFSDGYNGMYSHDGNIGNVWLKESSVTLNFVDMVVHLDRLWGFEEDSEDLYGSVNLNPTNFTDSTDAILLTVGAGVGGKLMRIAVGDDGNLYIFKQTKIFALLGRSPAEFEVREVHPSLGLAARWSLQKVNSAFVGLMNDFEMHSFAGTVGSDKIISYDISLGGDYTKDLIPILNRDRMVQICSVFHNNIYRMSFTENGAIQNNLEYCFNTINETDFLTRGNNVSTYCRYSRTPDLNQLITGRSDAGYLMKQYHGLNFDNQATSPTMSIKLRTKFYGFGQARNLRVRRVWVNFQVLGGEPLPIRTYLDARNAVSDSTTDEYTTFGEKKSNITLLNIASQDAITSRQIPRHSNSKGLNVCFEISETKNNRDVAFSSIEAELIVKNTKRSHKVGV